jgi:hypothetical protein
MSALSRSIASTGLLKVRRLGGDSGGGGQGGQGRVPHSVWGGGGLSTSTVQGSRATCLHSAIPSRPLAWSR